MNKVLATTLHRAVCERFDYLDHLVTDDDLSARAAIAESEITRLTAGWRALLALHRPNGRGQCIRCRRRWRRSRCRVWTIAHQYLIGTDTTSPARTPVRS